MEIGDEPRRIKIEPLTDPVPRETPSEPVEVPGGPEREKEPAGV